MLLRVLNWVPVLFGLKFAGVAAADAIREPEAERKTAFVTASERTGADTASKLNPERRTASGTSETRLWARSETPIILNESFVFAELVSPETADTERKSDHHAPAFVARPLPVATQRPVARLKQAKISNDQTVKSHPGQVKQANRPAARASLKVAGKTAPKKVVWMSRRQHDVVQGANIIQFPSTNSITSYPLRKAA